MGDVLQHTCSAIHHPAGDRGCSGEDRIYNWRPVIQSTPEGSMWCYTSPLRVNCGTEYSTVCTGESILRLLFVWNLKKLLRLAPLIVYCPFYVVLPNQYALL